MLDNACFFTIAMVPASLYRALPMRTRFGSTSSAFGCRVINSSPTHVDAWHQLRFDFVSGINLPIEPDRSEGTGVAHSILTALRSPHRWRHSKLIEVLTAYTTPTQLLRALINALMVYQRADQIRSEDHVADEESKKFTSINANHPDYRVNQQFDGLVAFLFPELATSRRTDND